MSLQQQSGIYPVSLTDNDWAQILQNNKEAQDLLSTAIAQHEQYREDDPIKRKGVISQSHSKSDHLLSNGETPEETQQHLSENEHSSDEGHSPGEGKPAPKKAGRKPLTTEPTNKRKAQNRAAQRAFRDRKERYVKSLEDRIKELEELNPGKTDSKLAEENMNLKVLVQKLETENYFLKEQAFTFDFPISQPGVYNKNLAHSQTTSNSDQSSQSPATQTINSVSTSTPPTPAQHKPFSAGSVAKPLAYNQLPWSPPSSLGDSVPNSPLETDRSTPEQETVSQPTYADNAGVVPRFRNNSPEEIALFSSILDGTGNTSSVANGVDPSLPIEQNKNSYITYNSITQLEHLDQFGQLSPLGHLDQSSTLSMSSTSPANTLAGLSEHSASPTLEDLVNTPLFSTHTNGGLQFTPTTSNLSMPPITFEQTQALFTDFRDPSDPHDFFASFEDPVEASFPDDTIGGLFNDQLLDFGAFANSSGTPTPTVTTAPPTKVAAAIDDCTQELNKEGESPKKGSLLPLSDGEKAIPCPQVWEHIAKHPNFDDADIDELCAELKSKAKCSGHGPVIALSDVDKLMNRLNQE
ncbi:DNA-binding transcription factor yap1 [Mortierella sp. AD011]|nr:DNA-binding transcription factor yap1 [Mortierella sp. AD010]KAF9394351.1 DNA-binding transcription factor yap1 [Mortierella sp. AD011]